jgi:hypothetical protein
MKFETKWKTFYAYPSGDRFWRKYGKRHRENKPAVTLVNGTKRWYQNGLEVRNK